MTRSDMSEVIDNALHNGMCPSGAAAGYTLDKSDDAHKRYVADLRAIILSALDAAGLCVVPKEPTEEMLDGYWHWAGESKEMRARTHTTGKRIWDAFLRALAAQQDGEG